MARLGIILTSALCLSTAAAAAQEAPDANTAPGGYAGVCPGTANPPAVDVPAGQAPARITWPGFQMLPDQGSRIFLQATIPFQYSTETRGKTLVISMGDVRPAGENNGRPLETRFFNTPVLRAAIKRVKKETQLVIELRAEVAPRVHTATGPNGYFFLYLDFPPGQYVDAPAAGPAIASPATSSDPMLGGSIGARASNRSSAGATGNANVSTSGGDDERPPAVRANAGGAISVRGTR